MTCYKSTMSFSTSTTTRCGTPQGHGCAPWARYLQNFQILKVHARENPMLNVFTAAVAARRAKHVPCAGSRSDFTAKGEKYVIHKPGYPSAGPLVSRLVSDPRMFPISSHLLSSLLLSSHLLAPCWQEEWRMQVMGYSKSTALYITWGRNCENRLGRDRTAWCDQPRSTSKQPVFYSSSSK